MATTNGCGCDQTSFTATPPSTEVPEAPCGSCDTTIKSQPEDTPPAPNFPQIGGNGNWFIDGQDTGNPSQGAAGSNGSNGVTPHISAWGTWMFGECDTGILAWCSCAGQTGEGSGEKGDKGDPGSAGITPTIGLNGNWHLGSLDTGFPSRGLMGHDGFTPYIGGNGNWFVNGQDTGNPSQGAAGSNGQDGNDATFNPTTKTIKLSVMDKFRGIIKAGQLVNSDEPVSLDLTQLAVTAGLDHTTDTAIVTTSEDFDCVTINVGLVYVGTAAHVSPTLRLLKGGVVLAESATAYQTGANGHVRSSNAISFVDVDVASGTQYTLIALAGSTVLGAVSYESSSCVIVGHRTEDEEVLADAE